MDNGWSWFATPQGAREILRIGRCPHTTWNIPAGACDSCAIAIISAAVHEERAAIAAWLRNDIDATDWIHTLANLIERGEHRPCPAK